jgi:deoxyribodipyrimidine photo-lyase
MRQIQPVVDKTGQMFYICSMSGVHIVWFRQDLRVHDHAPLKAANLAATRDRARVLPLFIAEPDLVITPVMLDALRDLETALEQRGAALHYRTGDAVTVLSELHRAHNVLSVYTHETTRDAGADRDVQAWCLRAGVAVRDFPQFGPQADSGWDAFMSAPRQEAPSELVAAQIGVGQRPSVEPAFEIDPPNQKGGRRAAIQCLKSGLSSVSDLQKIAASGRESGGEVFAQLRPHLDLGVLSLRETWQAAVTARNQYLNAGHEIRAAQITELIKQLPQVYWRARSGLGAARPGRRGEAVRTKRSDDPQLSLDLDPTGTA